MVFLSPMRVLDVPAVAPGQLSVPRCAHGCVSTCQRDSHQAQLKLVHTHLSAWRPGLGLLRFATQLTSFRPENSDRRGTCCPQRHEGSAAELEALLAAARQVAAEGEALPLKLDRECRPLRDAATLYCLCRLPYDQDRPMLACDYCSNWFHYDCVGLDPPGGDLRKGGCPC